GVIVDVVPDSSAWKAGAAPGMKVIGVEQRRYTKNVMRDLIRWSGETSSTIRLLLENGDFFREISVEAIHGERYPTLERIAGAPDVLGSILAPRSKTTYNSDAAPTRRQRPISELHGNVLGLSPAEKHRVERLYRRRIP